MPWNATISITAASCTTWRTNFGRPILGQQIGVARGQCGRCGEASSGCGRSWQNADV
jgi:hypothetical protein